jgi:phage shock protein PspC (stress-responsive transcriptional regulator)
MRVDPERTLTRPPKTVGMVPRRAPVGEDGTVHTAYENGTGPARPAWRATPRPPLVRQRQGKVIAGVAAGLAEHLGVPVVAVRVALVLTSIPLGAGLAVYVFLWATMREVGDVDPGVAAGPNGSMGPGAPVAGTAAGGAAGATSTTTGVRHHVDLASLRTWLRSGNQAVVITLLGVGALAVAGALWLGSAGFDVHAEVMLPVVAIVIGAIFFWSQLDDTDTLGARRPVRWIWLLVGLALTILGLVGLLVRGTNVTELWQVAGAVLAALVGAAVLSAPWILRLWSNLRVEQAARIRATERADIAAHLHDSVLQTLALIQRQSGDSATVARGE